MNEKNHDSILKTHQDSNFTLFDSKKKSQVM